MTDEAKQQAEAEIRGVLSKDVKDMLEHLRSVHPDPPVTFPPFARAVAERLVEELRVKLLACLDEKRYGDAEPLIRGLQNDLVVAASLIGIEQTSIEIDSFNNLFATVLSNFGFLANDEA